MKKWMRALAMALALLAPCALAEGTAASLATLTGVEWIDGTTLLAIEGESGEAMANLDGVALTEPLYTNFSADCGVIIAAQQGTGSYNAYGAMRADGTELIPFAYGDIEVLSPEWAVAYKLVEATADNYDYTVWFEDDVYLLIDTVDIYNLATGECLATLPRANFADAQTVGHSLNVEDRATGEVTTYDAAFNVLGNPDNIWDEDFAQIDLRTFYNEDGMVGLEDGAGNVVVEPVYGYIASFYGGYACVEVGGKTGLIDETGALVLPTEFDGIDTSYQMPVDANGETTGYNAFGYFAIEVDGKLGYADQQGNITCAPTYSIDALENNGASATFTDLEGKLHILAADGVETVVEGYDDVYPLSYMGGLFYRVRDAEYNYGVIDWHGEVVLPLQYAGVSASGDGRYVLAEIDYETSELFEITLPVTGDAAPADDSTVAEPADAADTNAGANVADANAAGTDAADAGAANAAGTDAADTNAGAANAAGTDAADAGSGSAANNGTNNVSTSSEEQDDIKG